MGGTNPKLSTAVETYLDDLRRVRASGGATGERSSYGPLANLLNAVGATLRPKVFCVGELADQGAGHPDFGLYTAKQVQRGRPREGQAPERGVVEVKSPHEDLRAPAVREQVTRYWGRYRLVLVTNLREFGLVGPDAGGGEAMLESFRLADDGAERAGIFLTNALTGWEPRTTRPLPYRAFDRLAGVLARVVDTRRLGEVRDWIGDCATGEALMARLGNGAGSGL